MQAVTIDNVTVGYHNTPILVHATCVIPAGILCAFIGPNGAGKTTLLKTIVDLIKPFAGSITIFNTAYQHIRKRVAYIPQRSQVDWDFPVTVFDVVMMGRYQHIGWFAWPSKQDKQLVFDALEAVGMTAYADRPIGNLSGGQQQRVFLARALAQEADLYIMDEPFVGIDSATEHSLITLFKTLRSQGKTMVIVHHDLHTVTAYFDWIVLINRAIIAHGPIETVFNQHYLDTTYKRHMYIRHG